MLYGYRVYGPYDPARGHRFNHHKLLLDPYAKALAGNVRWSDAQYGYRIGSPREDLQIDRRDNASGMPKCVVVGAGLHVGRRPAPLRAVDPDGVLRTAREGFHRAASGRAAGAARHVRRFGVAGRDRLPARARGSRRSNCCRSTRSSTTGDWSSRSCATIGATIRSASSRPTRAICRAIPNEFKTMVKHLHEAGIEVMLDVVYNHTAEGNHLGPTFSFHGIDNASYYRLAEDKRFYDDVTGTGNTLDLRHPRVLQMVMDSLRYWVEEMHVDGFRFDLAPALARDDGGYRRDAALFKAIQQDPVLSRVKMIAEPWDVGPGGYQVGNFPPGWSEWNGTYRDTVRRFWHGDDGDAAGARVTPGRVVGSVRAQRAPAARERQLRYRPRRLHAARPRLVQPQAQRGESRGQPRRQRTTTRAGTAASKARPTTRRSSTCASGRSAISSRRCCCRWACRCCWPATSSAARSAVTTTPTVRTTRSRGSTGTARARATSRWRSSSRRCCGCAANTRLSNATHFITGNRSMRAGAKTSPG